LRITLGTCLWFSFEVSVTLTFVSEELSSDWIETSDAGSDDKSVEERGFRDPEPADLGGVFLFSGSDILFSFWVLLSFPRSRSFRPEGGTGT